MKYYTNVSLRGDNALIREIEDNEKVSRIVPVRPFLFQADPNGDYSTVEGKPVSQIRFGSIDEAWQAIRSGAELYGMDKWLYQFLHEEYYGKIEFDQSKITTSYLDIEAAFDQGFSDVKTAEKPVTAISVQTRHVTTAFGCGNFYTDDPYVVYERCNSEQELLKTFLDYWEETDPDIVSGWNIVGFDIPYLINRIRRLLGRKYAKRLSPWRIISERDVRTNFGKQYRLYEPLGVSVLDYMFLYRKLIIEPRESYSLNHIASVELGEGKMDYSEYASLIDLYRNDFQKFMSYNIRDTQLLPKLEKKLGLITLVMAVAYDAKINYEDVLLSSRPWDALIHGYLLEQKKVVPLGRRKRSEPKPYEEEEEDTGIVGGFVKTPNPGQYDWVVSFDVASEYPHVVMQHNISHDAYVGTLKVEDGISLNVDGMLDGKLTPYRQYLQENNLTLTANLRLYKREPQGFIPTIMDDLFKKRSVARDKVTQARKEGKEAEVAQYDAYQKAIKVLLNSGFGCLSNPHFRWFRNDHAEAITTTGQLVIRNAERAINAYMNKLMKTEGVDYVIAIDTDSLFVHFGPLIEKLMPNASRDEIIEFIDTACKERIEPVLARCFEKLAAYMNAPRNRIKMKRETICAKGIWIAKKNYILSILDQEGARYTKPKTEVKGIKGVKPSTPEACRKKIMAAIELILQGDQNGLWNLIDEFRKEFNQLPLEDIAFSRTISGLDKYKETDVEKGTLYKDGCPIQVKGALVYNSMLEKHGLVGIPPIYNGDKGKYCYLTMPNPAHEKVITINTMLPKEFGLENFIDRHTQFEKAFLSTLDSITEAIGWSKETTLDSFF